MSDKFKDLIAETILETNDEKSNTIKISEELQEFTQTVKTDKSSEDIAKPIADNITAEESPNSTSSYIVIVLILFCLIFLIGIFSTVFAFLNIGSTKIISGISINGIDVS